MSRLCKHTGRPLPPNLYNDPRRKGVYRYRRPDRTMLYFRASYEEAVREAELANQARAGWGKQGRLIPLVEDYLSHMAQVSPERVARRSWKDGATQLRAFAKQFATTDPRDITVRTLLPWWESLTYDQQHNRRFFFSGFFTWAAGREAVKTNPFNPHNDAHLKEREKPAKKRAALSLPDFWAIYEKAEPHIQVAMKISLATTMRRGDIADLKFEDIKNGQLRRTISKSLHQRGTAGASHLAWDLNEHEALAQAIQQGRELSLQNRRCPYIVNAMPKRRTKGKPHQAQVSPEAISRGFAKARDLAGISKTNPPTFHEVRGLAITQMAKAYGWERTQLLAAHTDGSITRAYAAGQEPEYINQTGMVAPK